MAGLADFSLVQAADAVATGEATSLDLLHACWANLDAVNPYVNAMIWQEREAAELRRPGRRRGGAKQDTPGTAARRADGTQGHVLSGREAQYLRFGVTQGFPSQRHRDRHRAHGSGRRLRVRRTEHGRVRAEPDWAQQDVWRLSQSMEPAVHHRWVVVGVRGLGRGTLQLHGAGVRHRRLNPPPGLRLRHHWIETDPDPRLPFRRDAIVVLARQCRSTRPHGPRLRPGPGGDRGA